MDLVDTGRIEDHLATATAAAIQTFRMVYHLYYLEYMKSLLRELSNRLTSIARSNRRRWQTYTYDTQRDGAVICL